MASHLGDNIIHGSDHTDTHASNSRWRHQESSSYARHAAAARAREADERNNVGDLSNFLQGTRIEPQHAQDTSGTGPKYQPIAVEGGAARLEVACGPLLNYRRMENETWFGSVLIVTNGGGLVESTVTPVLKLSLAPGSQTVASAGAAGPQSATVNGVDYSNFEDPAATSGLPQDGQLANAASSGAGETNIEGTKLYSDPVHTFWRFDLEVPMKQAELHCKYSLPGLTFLHDTQNHEQSFFIPAISDSMRILFHSCNGFSVGTDEAAWSGPALWNDVLRVTAKAPFHVMIGGGDQIYNDGIRVHGPLRPWTDIASPHKRKEFPFSEKFRRECDEYYVNNYIRWYSTEPFASANGQIPQLNLWDDHDIIDGFGSYTDDFMHCGVFRGIGGVAHKYYLLFQHHLAPPVSTYTTDAPEIAQSGGVDPRQLENTFVLEEKTVDPGYIIGPKPGPYVQEHSRSIYARLGARIAFFGLDARTERTRKQVNYPETYDLIFSRLRQELGAARSSQSPIQHLVVLLGIPIAYPRLTWLENIFSSPVMGPLKFLNKRFGFGGSFFNSFDGGVDLLDDLDDHYTARTHKKERLYIVEQLQALASEFSVRISILGGDVHLAAVGRFYSNPKLDIPVGNDHRYMANIISSAIVNKPPPQAVANLLARRNKLHHLDEHTDETLMNFFDKDPGTVAKTASSNHVTMPSRNWAMITENAAVRANTDAEAPVEPISKAKDGHSWLHQGEVNAGSTHKAANSETHGKGSDGSLDVCIRVEIDQHDKEGKTLGYGMTIPRLHYESTLPLVG